MARFEEFYKDEVVPKLVEKFGYKSPMEVPAFVKIVLNMGVGEGASDKKVIEAAAAALANIAGQTPIITKARKAIAAFNKLREGSPVGVTVTLRRKRAMQFFQRLVTIAFCRERDFRGVSGRSFDGRGNYSIGIKDISIFPESDDLSTVVRGMDITIVTSAKTDEEAKALLASFKFPFKN